MSFSFPAYLLIGVNHQFSKRRAEQGGEAWGRVYGRATSAHAHLHCGNVALHTDGKSSHITCGSQIEILVVATFILGL